MTWITKPRVQHAGLPRNELGLTLRDYEGSMSTLCAGCGHDSVSAAMVQAFFELNVRQEQGGKWTEKIINCRYLLEHWLPEVRAKQ